MTEQQIADQEREIARLAEELSRLNSVFDEQKKALGLPADEPVTFDEKEMTPELQKAMDTAKAEAERAGRARSAQASSQNTTTSAPRARRGAVRI